MSAATASTEHHYVSTACQHDFHDRCRKACKFCSTPCACVCHDTGGAQ